MQTDVKFDFEKQKKTHTHFLIALPTDQHI